MLDSNRKGYAVMTEDRSGVGLCDESLEVCKQYCRNGNIIVKVSPKHHGYSLRVYFHEYNKKYRFMVKFYPKNILWFHWSTQKIFFHSYGEEVYRSGE